jgi:23S rRNA (cytidine1920-2'-O)/16S rRNA (cytidine1409-2'-O)-methyltransferase
VGETLRGFALAARVGRLLPYRAAAAPGGGGSGYLLAMTRRRIDTLLAERGLAGSRTSAAQSVRAGRVRIGPDGPFATKPGQMVAADADLLIEEPPRYVSRGGLKLENALDALGVEVEERSCLDVGASTGGFTDCLLQRGAERVIALDVGRGQLDWRLRNDPRVEAIDGLNARELEPADLPWAPELATVDVSFISLAKVLGPIAACMASGGEVLALVKPQFELAPHLVGKGGVVRSGSQRREALRRAGRAATDAGLAVLGCASSGLPGPKGNRETFIFGRRDGGSPVVDVEAAIGEVEP